MLLDMLDPQKPESCLIIGAGIAGLAAAKTLKANGVEPILLEKESVPGGRMSTVSFDGGVFDTGAQCLTAADPHSREVVEELLSAGAVREWCKGFIGVDGVRPNDRYTRYRGVRGMATIAKTMAEGLDIRCNSEVTSVSFLGNRWEAELADGSDVCAPTCIVATPIAETLKLFAAGNRQLNDVHHSRLAEVSFDPCITVLATLLTSPDLPTSGGLEVKGEPIEFIAGNQRKGISPGAYAVTIQCGPLFSREHMASEDQTIIDTVLEAAIPLIGAEVRNTMVVRRENAQAVNPLVAKCLTVSEGPMLVLAGNGFCGSNLESALVSGHAAAVELTTERKYKIRELINL